MNKIEIYFSDDDINTIEGAKALFERNYEKKFISWEKFLRICIMQQCKEMIDYESYND